MSDVFISYARSTTREAQVVAATLRDAGYQVWRDDELPAHRAYTDVIEERLTSARAVVVIWSAEAVKSEWVRSEANRARAEHKLVQLRIDAAPLPMPFDQIQCADLTGWTGDADAHDWRKVLGSVGVLVGEQPAAPPPVAPPPPLPTKPSIAVMPFANLSGDPEQDYFADGMVEEITTALSRISSLFVIASGSTLALKGKGVAANEAGRRLGVRYVLEGSVRQAGDRVRIMVKLTSAADAAQLWADRFEDTLDDVFALQDRVALGVAAVIEPRVQQAEIRRVSARPTDQMGSYDLYLRSVPLYRSLTKTSLFEALELLNRAIALDPDYAPALSLAANCHRLIVAYGWSDDAEASSRLGLDLAHRSLKDAGDDAQVLANAAWAMAVLGQDLGAAVEVAERATSVNPGSAIAWLTSGRMRLTAGDPDRAVQDIETAMRLDPMGPNRGAQMLYLGQARFLQRRFEEAATLLRENSQQTDGPIGLAFLAASYGHLGQASAAVTALARYRDRSALPIEDLARTLIRDPAQRQLFLDGVALAEGRATASQHG